MSKTLLFAYGTICESEIQKELFGKELPFFEDNIIGYEVVNDLEIEGAFYPRLKEKPHGVVNGKVYEVTDEQLAILDDYETDAYFRKILITKGGKKVQVYFEK